MKILHVITRLILGGAQQNTVLSAAAQVEAGHGVGIVYGPIYGPEGSLLDEARASGAQLHELASMRRAVSPWHDPRCYRALRGLIRRERPDVVHTHSSKAGILGRLAAWAEGVPAVIHTVHGLPFHGRQPRLVHAGYVRAERLAAARCHHLIAIAPEMVAAFAEAGIAGPERFTVVPSGIDLSRFPDPAPAARAEARRRLGVPPDAEVLGIVARLDRLKGHDDLLAVFPGLLRERPRLWLVMIGDGFERARIEARVAAFPFADRVVMTGRVKHDEVARLLPGVDVKALPSYQEGQSRTLAEALLCGCGIAGYDVGGIPSVCIDGQTGLLAPRGDRAALGAAILTLLADAPLRRRLAEQGGAHVRQHFDARRMVAMIQRVYDRTLAGHAPPPTPPGVKPA